MINFCSSVTQYFIKQSFYHKFLNVFKVDWPVCTEDEANLNITKEIEVMSIEKIKTDLSQNTS